MAKAWKTKEPIPAGCEQKKVALARLEGEGRLEAFRKRQRELIGFKAWSVRLRDGEDPTQSPTAMTNTEAFYLALKEFPPLGMIDC